MIYNESLLSEKFFGVLPVSFFIFLYIQSSINRKNLIARIELAQYLELESRRIETLFNSVPGLFCYFLSNGKIISSNNLWKKFSDEYDTEKSIFDIVEGDFIKNISEFIESEESKRSFEFQFQNKSDKPIYLCDIQKISNSNGIILFMVDISAVKKAQYEMELKDAHFQHSARLIELGEMVGSIAHEINNPLSIVLGRAQVSKRLLTADKIDNPQVDEKIMANLETIEGASSRISKLVNGMKSLVRNAESDPLTFQSLLPHLEMVKFLAKSRAELKKVSFEIVMNSDDLSSMCRPSQVEQVIINLVNNAIDAAETTEDRWTKLIISSNSEYLVFEVTDSGFGISEQVLSKIWNPFFTTKEIGKGTGLGLSISHSIMLENNGKLYYKKDSANTTFVVEVPRQEKIAA